MFNGCASSTLDTLRAPFDTATDLFFGTTPVKEMKIFGRKKTAKEERPAPAKTPEPSQSFYTQHVGDEPLNELTEGQGRHVRRTSLHSPARRRETSNRAGNKEIFFLLFRVGLVVALLVGGYLALKLVLGRLAEPTEKEQEQWVVTEELMKKGSAATPLPDAPETQFTAELIGKRLWLWNEAERHMRAAEALARRGIEEEAVDRLKQVLRFAPDHRAAQRMLMELYMRSGNYAAAVPIGVRLLDQNPAQQDVQEEILRALYRLGQGEASLILATQMLETEPNNLEVLGVAAAAQRASENPDQALVYYARMLKNDNQNLEALDGSGKIYQQRGEWALAVPYYLELIRIRSGANDYHELARCYAQLTEAGKAVIFMGQAASLFGEAEVSVWLQQEKAFFPIHETVEYRSFADSIVGEETRKAIEEISRREVEKKTPAGPAGLELPTQPELKLRPDS